MPEETPAPEQGDIRTRLRAELEAAIRARDRIAVAAIRVAIATIDNAEAQPLGAETQTERHLAAASASDVPRREIDESAAIAIVQAEIEAMRDAAQSYEALGDNEGARNAARQATVLDEIVSY